MPPVLLVLGRRAKDSQVDQRKRAVGQTFRRPRRADRRRELRGHRPRRTSRISESRTLTDAELFQSIHCFLSQFKRELPGRHFSAERRGLP
jgi:hypothetical protein